jgi:hypothetical protein
MATAILNSNWSGVPPNITPSMVNRVLDRLQCTACGLTKRNRQPVGEGSGIHQPFPAQNYPSTTKASSPPLLPVITMVSFFFVTASAAIATLTWSPIRLQRG